MSRKAKPPNIRISGKFCSTSGAASDIFQTQKRTKTHPFQTAPSKLLSNSVAAMKSLAAASLLALAISLTTQASSAPDDISLSPERAGHAATLLNSGLVLITGGVNENATLNSALLYDPALGTFTPT